MNNYESLINTVLDERYRLMAIISSGGMAVVYEADDLAMNRKVAVKMLKDGIKEDIREVKRFINESKAVAMLSHPNIVQIYDVSEPEKPEKNPENAESYQYIVMELIDGITLKDYIVRKGRLKWGEAISYTEQILAGLNHAHEKGIIHRDVKPQNVMLLRNGSLKIIDFGIAKMPDSEPLTMTDKAIGTVHYISPEQASGTGTVSTVSDIYSVGIILYEMTAGKLPFNGNTAIQVAMMQINDVPKNPRIINPEIPKGLSQIILKAISKSPSDRYPTAVEMIKHLNILSANPAVVFNNMPNMTNGDPNANPYLNKNNNNIKSVVPVTINSKDAQRKDVEAYRRNNKSLENVQRNSNEISEGEMRRRGRVSQKKLRRRNSRSMLPIISGVTLAFLIVLGISAFNIILLFMQINSDQNEVVRIENYIGQVYDEDLKLSMQKLGLFVKEIKYENNERYGENEIISQIPEGGAERVISGVSGTIPIILTISKGPDSYIVEDLVMQSGREVWLMLENKLINVDRKSQDDDTIPRGYIIYTDPGPGTVLKSGDTLTIYESTGQEFKRAKMPNLVGMSQKQAEKTLAEFKIDIKEIISEYSDIYAPGYITDQDIEAERLVPEKATKVTLKVSMGPRYTEPPWSPPVTQAEQTEQVEGE